MKKIKLSAETENRPLSPRKEKKIMNQKEYITLEMEITEFETEDVITTSGEGVEQGAGGDD